MRFSSFLRLPLLGWAIAVSAHADPAIPGKAELRLLTPLSSTTSAPGSGFRAVVIAPFLSGNRVFMPPGTIVYGTIIDRKEVGIGLVHERASLSLRFREYKLPDQRRFSLEARVLSIRNGREYVTPQGQIKGVLAADSPQRVLDGFWIRPTSTAFLRSFIGLNGLSGRIWTGYEMGPWGAVALFAIRCAMFHMPDPEIQLPAGAEMQVLVKNVSESAPSFPIPPAGVAPVDLADWLTIQPILITKANGRPVKDIINVAFSGSHEDLVNAFQAAGWQEAEVSTVRSSSRFYKAFTTKTGYANAPVSILLYRGFAPDLVFQKSLNNVLKRDHVRIWRAESDAGEFWLGAATRDVGMGFDSHTFRFTHAIEARIDMERSKVADDLAYPGCADPPAYLVRPAAERLGIEAAGVVTDGRLAFIHLRACDGQPQFNEPDETPTARNPVFRIVRRMLLEGRQYVLRENAFFWSYRVVKWSRAYAGGSEPQP